MKKLPKKEINNRKGFTLVELMVVVVIIGVLVAIAVPVYSNVTKTANENANAANIRIIEAAIDMYRAEHGVSEEPELNDLIDKNFIKENIIPPAGFGDYTITYDEQGEPTVANASV